MKSMSGKNMFEKNAHNFIFKSNEKFLPEKVLTESKRINDAKTY